ncbi:Hypothetical_protein [Hexamita inflata]|uniref:Hypothetical_protein n=1 Tax=Hexamita inflata TaxID=28002 RepID=A0AA86R6K8_9EUKA|nr:Hypothetical protein HINF_LOCUS54637 [Hexamita inflata]
MLLHLEEAPSEERVNARFSCVFIGFRTFIIYILQIAQNQTKLRSENQFLEIKLARLLTLLLFMLGRQGCLFQNIYNVLYFLQTINFLQEYLALESVDEFTFIKRLQDQNQVGLNLINWPFWVVFNVNVYYIFHITAKLLLKLFRINIFPMESLLACLCFDFNSYKALAGLSSAGHCTRMTYRFAL